MKSLFIISLLSLMSFVSFSQYKKIQEVEFSVQGNCGMCQARIETAALISGVKQATWDKSTQSLKVIYRADKIDIMEVHKAVAKVGHNTSLVKAEESDYKKLPYCCAYIENSNVH